MDEVMLQRMLTVMLARGTRGASGQSGGSDWSHGGFHFFCPHASHASWSDGPRPSRRRRYHRSGNVCNYGLPPPWP